MKNQDEIKMSGAVANVSMFLTAKEAEFLPHYATDGAAGADVRACIPHSITIESMHRKLIATGLHAAIPTGYEIQVRSRSGLSLEYGVVVLNAPGTIDADYRGEIGVILMNFGTEPFVVERGMRIAQIIVAEVSRAEFIVTDKLPGHSVRATNGFGHTGLH